MGDPFQKVQKGQRLRIPAAAYNAFIDAARDMRQRGQDRQRSATPSPRHSGLILVKNSSPAACGRFAILGIDAPLFSPDEAMESFANQSAVLGVLPTAEHRGLFVVTQTPLNAGDIGPAIIAGVSPAQVDVSDELHGYAEPAIGQTEYLQSASAGSAAILWKQAGAGLKWAIIRLGNALPAGLFPVLLAQVGGEDGTSASYATWTYDVTDLDGVFLAGDMPLQRSRPLMCSMIPAAMGTAYYHAGQLYLWDGDERMNQVNCQQQ